MDTAFQLNRGRVYFENFGKIAVTPELTENEKGLIKKCLLAASEGPFFPDWEFSLLFGFERSEIKVFANADIEWSKENIDFFQASVSAANNLTGYPHDCKSEFSEYGLETEEILNLLSKLRAYLK